MAVNHETSPNSSELAASTPLQCGSMVNGSSRGEVAASSPPIKDLGFRFQGEDQDTFNKTTIQKFTVIPKACRAKKKGCYLVKI